MFNPNFFREQKYYSKKEYESLFENSTVVNQLLIKEIIKFKDNLFKFNYVGVIIIGDDILYCYPKYINSEDNIYNDFKEILSIIRKFNKLESLPFYENDEFSDSYESLISLSLFFIEDYFENGIYNKTQEILEINGNGEIDWNRTVNENFPIIQNEKPIYTELRTRYKRNDLTNYFRLLHKCIVTNCSKFFESNGLLELFDLNSIELSQKNVNDFGDDDYIIERLTKELNVEFNTHKRSILKAMISYVSKNNHANDNYLTLYGTNEYWAIWEKMCSKVFKNNLNSDIGELFENNDLKGELFKDHISQPVMYLDGKMKRLSKLRPDLVVFNKKENQFIILDAKYRNLNYTDVEDKLKLYDINKQFLYQLIYSDIIQDVCVINALLFPTYDGEVKNRGFIEFDIFSNLAKIQLIDVPAHELNQLYLNGETKSVSYLELSTEKEQFDAVKNI